ncbi:MAG: SH3 domain-containing protein [Bacteroidia bacterium]|nr:SH3 domain-containing protein [Bacteroidia bacterium]
MMWGLLLRAQTYYTVIAKNGVVVRQNPDSRSKQIASFSFGQTFEVHTVPGSSIAGNNNWIEVKLSPKSTGYVSTQYVLRSYLSEEESRQGCLTSMDKEHSAKVMFKKFDLFIYCYAVFKNCYDDLIRKDSVYLCEETFYETSNKILEITPKIAIDSVSVFYTKVESIDEQVDYRKPAVQAKNWSYETWYKNTVHWKGMEEYVRLEKRNNFFRLPIVQYQNVEKLRKKKMALRDTLVNLSGETDNIATMVYKGKPCTYLIESVILKIILYPKNSAPETRHIKIILSYGC